MGKKFPEHFRKFTGGEKIMDTQSTGEGVDKVSRNKYE